MTLARLDKVLLAARVEGRGVGAFNVIHIEHAEALVAAAERVSLPVVLQISENAVRYHGSLAPIAAATKVLAERATVPVVLHLDHAVSESLVDEAVSLGFTSVMFDGSTLDDEVNRATTRSVVGRCHSAGVSVEAELGEVGGKDGVHAPGVRTDPDDAAAFAELARVLKPGGIHRIAVPNFGRDARAYVESLDHERPNHDDTLVPLLGQAVRREAYGTSLQSPLRRRVENLVLGDARRRGETHQWGYDEVNLRQILEAAGFVEFVVAEPNESRIPGWAEIGLEVDPDGTVYKSGSLWAEARKPG